MMKIAVGSKNRVKVAAAAHVCGQAWPDCEVLSVEADSGVSEQPIGWEEIVGGASNRARAAFRWLIESRSDDEEKKRADIGICMGIGMESGVLSKGQDEIWLCNVVVAMDGRHEGLGEGLRIRLPNAWRKPLLSGQTLEEVLSQYGVKQAGSHQGAVGWLTLSGLDRRQLWEQAIWATLPPFIRPELYK